MKTNKVNIIVVLLLLSVFGFSQTAQEFIDSGIEKHKNKDYKGAAKDYSKAIKKDKKAIFAYYNRGLVEIGMQQYKNAFSDFTKTIELNDSMVDAYYYRAIINVNKKEYEKALPDISKVIELNEKYPNALTLRGQLYFGLQDKEAACKDFNKAKELGDTNADRYLAKYCGNKQQSGESLSLHWPESENWKVESKQETDQMDMLELLRNDETFDNWTEIGTMMSIKGAINIPLDTAMNMMFTQIKEGGINPKLTFIEKDETCEYPWILFKIETPKFKGDDNRPESQLWYIVQGKTSLYTNFRAIKEKTISKELETKWVEFFKTGKVVYLNE